MKTLCWAPISSSFRRYGTGSTLLPNDLLLLDIVRRRGGGVFAAGLRPALIRADEVLRELVERVLQLFGGIVVSLLIAAILLRFVVPRYMRWLNEGRA